MSKTREQKIQEIKKCFRIQPAGGWKEIEQKAYMEILGIEYKKSAKDYTDQEIDLIYNDLLKYKMI